MANKLQHLHVHVQAYALRMCLYDACVYNALFVSSLPKFLSALVSPVISSALGCGRVPCDRINTSSPVKIDFSADRSYAAVVCVIIT